MHECHHRLRRRNAVTQCSLLATQCPQWTLCPREVTRCPITTTVCPQVNVATQCPKVATVCPQITTQCPGGVAGCTDVHTQFPQIPTQCPPIMTSCPAGAATQCVYLPPCARTRLPSPPAPPSLTRSASSRSPSARSSQVVSRLSDQTHLLPGLRAPYHLPAGIHPVPGQQHRLPDNLQYHLPGAHTICPQRTTQCPPEPTFCCTPTDGMCRPEYHLCPTITGATMCPEVPTQCPAKPTFCPGAHDPVPRLHHDLSVSHHCDPLPGKTDLLPERRAYLLPERVDPLPGKNHRLPE